MHDGHGHLGAYDSVSVPFQNLRSMDMICAAIVAVSYPPTYVVDSGSTSNGTEFRFVAMCEIT